MEENNKVAVMSQKTTALDNGQALSDAMSYAPILSKGGDMVPQNFRGKPEACALAIDMANRIGVPVIGLMQNMYVVHGKPSMSSTFMISAINQCKRFTGGLRFKFEGKKNTDDWGCMAWIKDRDGEVIEGPLITMRMAKAEKWIDKPGSKWKTMPEVMLRYRAAAFFGRLYASDILLGLHTDDELKDSTEVEVIGNETVVADKDPLTALNESVVEAEEVKFEEVKEPKPSIKELQKELGKLCGKNGLELTPDGKKMLWKEANGDTTVSKGTVDDYEKVITLARERILEMEAMTKGE